MPARRRRPSVKNEKHRAGWMLTCTARVALLTVAAIVAGCSATATPSAPASTAGSSSPASAAGCAPSPSALPVVSHQAPEVEAVLPASVAGRTLTRWSLRGQCWLELASGKTGSDLDQLVTSLQSAAPHQLDLTNLAYGVAGRSDTHTDPPFFVYGAARPTDQAEIELAVQLLFSGAGFHDPYAGSDLRNYQKETIAGREVYLGTLDMLTQDEHQRGRPFLYQTDAFMFLVITDEDAWAADAIGQLPK